MGAQQQAGYNRASDEFETEELYRAPNSHAA
jgi:hypothetical protein